MSRGSFIMLGAVVGSLVGSLVPDLWQGGSLSIAGILLATLGGLAGIWLVVRWTA